MVGFGAGVGIGRRRGGSGAASAWSPASLANIVDYIDTTDLTRMWTDTGGTTPVTTDGDLIARIDGRMGLVSFQQATSGSRPTYKVESSLGRARFDGLASAMASAAALDLTAGDELTLFAAFYKASDAAIGHVVEHSANANTNNGTFAIQAPSGAGFGRVAVTSRGSVLATITNSSVTAPLWCALIAYMDISADILDMEINGTATTRATTDQGTGNFTSQTVQLGSRAGTSRFFNGDITAFGIVRGAVTGDDLTALRAWLAARMV